MGIILYLYPTDKYKYPFTSIGIDDPFQLKFVNIVIHKGIKFLNLPL